MSPLWNRLLTSPRWGALSNVSYRRLQTGNLLSNTGNFFSQVAQSWLVYHFTGSAAWVGFHAFAANGPTLLMALPAGALADRLNRRKMLLGVLLVWASLSSFLALLSGLNRLGAGLIIFIAALEGCCASAQRPVLGALTLDVVGRDHLPSAVALNSAFFNVARFIGPGLGGIILERYGPTMTLSLNAMSFLLILYAVWRLEISIPSELSPGPMLHQLRESLRFGLTHRGLRRLWWGSAVFCFLSGPIQGLLVVYVREAFGGGAREYGHMLSAMALGALIGATLSVKATRLYPRHRLISISALVYGLIGITLGLMRDYLASLQLMVLIGICHTSFLVSSMTAVQLLSPNRMRGRLVSVQGLMTLGMMPVGNIVGGLTAARLTTPNTLLLLMTAMTLFGIYTVRHRVLQIDAALAEQTSGSSSQKGR